MLNEANLQFSVNVELFGHDLLSVLFQESVVLCDYERRERERWSTKYQPTPDADFSYQNMYFSARQIASFTTAATNHSRRHSVETLCSNQLVIDVASSGVSIYGGDCEGGRAGGVVKNTSLQM